MNPEMAMVARRNEEVETLRGVIQQWNANRLDLFELSEPNEYLVFHGVMRFYFQDSGQKVATKCIRVASDATSQDVIETLIEKFRPDMRMLSVPEYALYEIHENGGSSGSKYHERRLDVTEKPLLVQLNWHKDDREGRFLLRRIDDTTNVPAGTFQESGSSFRRKLSKREKKQLKKQEKLNRVKSTGSSTTVTDENDSGVAEKLYTELPETSFTRSISNPEAVMRRRRQQKLERKLQQFRSKDGGPDTGGTLRIYGESLCKDVPYKTLLLSVRDSAAAVVREMLAKYGLDKEDPHNYCLVQVNNAIPLENSTNTNGASVPGENNNNREYILDDDECPLAILMNHPQSRGSIMFHVRRRPADYHPRKRKKKPQQKWNHHSPNNELLDYRYEDAFDRLPFFLELNPDGSDIANGTPKRHKLHPNVTEVGNERASPHSQSQFLQLFGPNIQPRHCVIAHTEGIVTVTPCSRDAETYVNGQRIYETTILHNGAIVKFGRIHNFRFLDPCYEERTRQRLDSSRSIHDYSYDRQSSREDTSSIASPDNRSASVQNLDTPTSNPPHNSTAQNYETTFDIDGNVETRSTSSQGNKDDNRSQRSVSSSREGNRLSNNYDRYPRGSDAILPAVLEIREETEEALLHALITYFEPTSPNFILAPAYTLYLVARFRASTHYRPELTPTERAHKLTLMLAKVAAMIHNIIQEQYCDVKSLALWLANSSELLHFLKMDRHISAFSLEAQDTLSDAVQISFRHLVSCLQNELATALPNFLLDHDDLNHESDDSATSSVLSILASAMALQRRCRVNAALTIQLFSQLFHYINVWLFNRIVAPNSTYCTRVWGARLKHRLGQIEIWAERQGLELAANCHLALIKQAAHLLQAPKYTAEDLSTLSPACFKLNSLQLRALFQKYQPTPYEGRLPHDLIDNVVRVAENLADELARSDGREVKLEEDADLLNTTFLVPDEGYTCEVIRGVPPGLIETLAPFQHAGLCRLSAQPASNGLWTVYMNVNPMQGSMARSPSAMSNRSGRFMPTQQEPDIQIIKLHKSNNGMGLSIVAAKGAGQDRLGIYIKSVVKGGAADADGRLQAGDQLLKVDGQSLVGITQEKAAEYLVKTGPTVTLEVAKQGAIYYGLATLLSQPSPVMSRASSRRASMDYMYRRPSQDNLPASMSLTNLGSHSSYADWTNSRTGLSCLGPIREQVVPRNPSGLMRRNSLMRSSGVGGGLKAKNVFTPRYGNFLHPSSALYGVGGLAACDDFDSTKISASSPKSETNNNDTPSSNVSNFLSVPIPNNRPKCYKIPPKNELCLCEDIFQQHQAKLIDCDHEDAKAMNEYLRANRSDENKPADVSRKSPNLNTRNKSLDNIYCDPDNVAFKLDESRRCKSDLNLTCDGSSNVKYGVGKLMQNVNQINTNVMFGKRLRFGGTLETIPSSASTSECCSETDSAIHKSSDSFSENSLVNLKSGSNQSLQSFEKANDKTRKLSLEEREKVLKELDEIVSGDFLKKIQNFSNPQAQKLEETNCSRNLMNDQYFTSLMRVNSSNFKECEPSVNKIHPIKSVNIIPSDSSDEDVPDITCGRVAALAKHFSKLGEAGIIKNYAATKNKNLNKCYGSQPNLSSTKDLEFCSVLDKQSEKITLPLSKDENKTYEIIFKPVGQSLKSVGFSMDSLIDVGQGVLLREVKKTSKKKEKQDQPRSIPASATCDVIFPTCNKEPLLRKIRSIQVDELEMGKQINTSKSNMFSKRFSLDSLNSNKLNSVNSDIFKSTPNFMKLKSNLENLKSKSNSEIDSEGALENIKQFLADEALLAKQIKSGSFEHFERHGSNFFNSRQKSHSFCVDDKSRLEEVDESSFDEISRAASALKDYEAHKSYMLKKLKSFKISIPERGKLTKSNSKLKRSSNFDETSGGSTKTNAVPLKPKHLVRNETISCDKPKPKWEKTYQTINQEKLKRWFSVNTDEASSNFISGEKDVDKEPLGRSGSRRLNRPHLSKIKKSKRRTLEKQHTFVITPIKVPEPLRNTNICTINSSESDGSPVTWWRGPEQRRKSDSDMSRVRGASLDYSPGPRRMSERDLPSRVLTEQSQNTRGQLPPHVPQIHSSKSVPSLHSANNEVPPIPRSNQEAFNQGYTRTSSTNSIPQSRTLRSRSSQNLNDSRSMNNAYPQGHPPNNVGMPHHQQLTPNYPPVHSPQQQYTPNYPHSPPHPVGHPPNHPMNHSGHYGGHMPGHPQQQYTPNYPQNPAGTPQGHTPNYPHSPPGPPPQQYSASIYAQSPPAHPPSHLSAQHSLNQSSQENGERFYQNLSVYRNQEIRQNGYIPQNTSLNQTASSISSPGNNVHGNLPSPTKNKYTASNADPPRGYYHPSSPGNQQPRQYQFQGTNPWEREEREKEQLRKREAARAWRDQQIAKLLSLGPHRSQSQEEQLKALKLEKEFERRAQEEEDEEDDQESAERAQGLLRLAQQQDEKRNNTANSTMSGRLQPQQNSNHAHLNGTLSRPTILPNLPVPQYNYNGYSSNQNSPAGDKVQTPSQRLDILHLSPSQPPQPPERGSSFAVMSQSVSALRSPPSQTLNNPHPPPVQNNRNETPTTKRVSFQETTTTLSSPAESISPPPPPPISEKVREDPNHFIDEAETLLASPKSPDTSFTGSTPGVIGAQEVYKDPRQRRLAEQQHQKLMSNRTSTVPEKLSFKEKMKMFAMETGENGTPRDKVKISKAQREIDNLGSGLTPTSNNSTTPVAATNGSST